MSAPGPLACASALPSPPRHAPLRSAGNVVGQQSKKDVQRERWLLAAGGVPCGQIACSAANSPARRGR